MITVVDTDEHARSRLEVSCSQQRTAACIFYCDRCRAGNVFKSGSIVDAAIPILAGGCCDSERNGVRSVTYVAERQFYIIGRSAKHDVPQDSGWPTRRSGDYFTISYGRTLSRAALTEPSMAGPVRSSVGNTGV